MSEAEPAPVYRSAVGAGGRLTAVALRLAPTLTAVLRNLRPLLRLGNLWIVTRYDDVLEVFASDGVYSAPYRDNLAVITGDEPFFLGMDDTPAYRTQIAAMRAVVLESDLARLGDMAEALAGARVAAAAGQIEIVTFVRSVAFDLMAGYFGIGEPADASLAFWGSRLFEFQFTGSTRDAGWRAEAADVAARFRDHIDRAIADRKALIAGETAGPDDVLGRCLARQAAGEPGYGDLDIRTAILCMIVGGPPQPPMVLPQAMEQLMRRPAWLAAAQAAARGTSGPDSDDRLRAIVFEAMRFDPLAPGFKRTALADHVLAAGSTRARRIPKGATVFAATASAMMDAHRIPAPSRFDPDRLPRDYVHFGHGLHECFGRFINHATLHRMLKPLLARNGLRRGNGTDGHLQKRGAFAHRLHVAFDR